MVQNNVEVAAPVEELAGDPVDCRLVADVGVLQAAGGHPADVLVRRREQHARRARTRCRDGRHAARGAGAVHYNIRRVQSGVGCGEQWGGAVRGDAAQGCGVSDRNSRRLIPGSGQDDPQQHTRIPPTQTGTTSTGGAVHREATLCCVCVDKLGRPAPAGRTYLGRRRCSDTLPLLWFAGVGNAWRLRTRRQG